MDWIEKQKSSAWGETMSGGSTSRSSWLMAFFKTFLELLVLVEAIK